MDENIKNQIQKLRSELAELNAKKEDLYSKKSVISKQIVDKINQIKQLRQERDERTEQVKSLKEERSSLNKGIGEVVQNLRGMNADKKAMQRKLGLSKDPVKIKQQIDKLNERIETEVLEFKQEQRIMKQIKELESQYSSTSEASGLFEQVNTTAKELKSRKKEADSVHGKIQKLAEESQERHEKIVKLSEEIDKLKEEEKTFDQPISELKEQIRGINEQLGEKLGSFAQQRGESKRNRQEQNMQALAEKQKAVQLKLERGEKLTTEDILILQSIPE